MQFSHLENKIADIVRPAIEDEGFTLYCVKIVNDLGQIVQVMAEDPKTGTLGVEDCKKLSRAVSALLDVEDPISGAYRLELSSPGIDRLLVQPEHFGKYKDFEIKAETVVPTETGQKRFRGIIKDANNDNVILATDQGEEVTLPFTTIGKAKLVMTEDLIDKTKKFYNTGTPTPEKQEEKN